MAELVYRVNNKVFSRFQHQIAFQNSTAATIALVSGYGGGKTAILGHTMVKASMFNSGIPNAIVSPTYSMAKKTTIPTIFEILEKHYSPAMIEGKDFTYHKSDHIFKIKAWKGIIQILSGENPSSLKGSNLGCAGIDEPDIQDIKVYENIIARLRHPGARRRQLYLTGTPEGFRWFQELCEGELMPKDFCLIRAKTTDNKALPQSYIDQLYEQYDENLIKAYLEGLFVNMTSGSAYHEFKLKNGDDYGNIWPNDRFEYDKTKPICVGMDFNYDPMTIVVGQETLLDGKFVFLCFDEFFLKNYDTDAAIEMFIEKYCLDTNNEIYFYPDPACYGGASHGAARSDITLIKNAFNKYNISPNRLFINPDRTHPLRKDRLNAVNKMLKNAKGERKLFFLEKLKRIKNDLLKITMEEYLSGSCKDKMLGHISDALGYVMAKRYKVKIDRYYVPQIE